MLKPPAPSHHGYRVLLFGIAVTAVVFGALNTQTGSTVRREMLPAIATVIDQVLPSLPSESNTVSAPSHIATPLEVRGLYLSAYSAGSAKTRARIRTMLRETSANAVIIDIKDATGKLSYMPSDPTLVASGVGSTRVSNIKNAIEEFHQDGVYVIGRLQVFEDPYRATTHPEDAYQSIVRGDTWTNYKGRAWVRADSQAVWEYTARIARDAYAQGFDEINLDYVRFPSDGALSDIDMTTLPKGRADTLTDFFKYMDQELRQVSRIPLSADLFGLTMSARGDLGIGQVLERVAPYVDYVAPMVYPSHFAKGTYGVPDPAADPYAIIHKSLSDGVAKLAAIGEPATKLRPWLQDFDMGATYDASMVAAQIRASQENGINSWMLWDPRNTYTPEAF